MTKLRKIYNGVYECVINDNILTVEKNCNGRGFSYELKNSQGYIIACDGFDELRLKDIKEMICQGQFN